MNWLLYIPGWLIGWAIVNGLVRVRDGSPVDGDVLFIIKIVTWTMLWIWFCWKFIA